MLNPVNSDTVRDGTPARQQAKPYYAFDVGDICAVQKFDLSIELGTTIQPIQVNLVGPPSVRRMTLDAADIAATDLKTRLP